MSMIEIQWHEEGRGHHHRHVATLGNKRIYVRKAPALFGRWEIVRPLPGFRPSEYAPLGPPRPNEEIVAYANDLREARSKAKAALRGERVERSASEALWVFKKNPRNAHVMFKRERRRKDD